MTDTIKPAPDVSPWLNERVDLREATNPRWSASDTATAPPITNQDFARNVRALISATWYGRFNPNEADYEYADGKRRIVALLPPEEK